MRLREPNAPLPRPRKVDLGIWRRAELIAAGYRDTEIRAAVRCGRLARLRAGWYARPLEPDRPRLSLDDSRRAKSDAEAAARTAVKAGGVLSCVSALPMCGVFVAPRHRCATPVHYRVARHRDDPQLRNCHGWGPHPPAASAIDPLPVALACASRCLPEDEWVAAVDSTYRQLIFTEQSLRAEWGQVPAWIEEKLAKCDANAQSGSESVARVRLRAEGYRVTPQAWIPGLGHVDLLVGDRLIVECDSATHHSSDADAAEDSRRDSVALRSGYITRRYRFNRIMNNWAEVLADIRAFTSRDMHRR